jgi:hypothetical protein
MKEKQTYVQWLVKRLKSNWQKKHEPMMRAAYPAGRPRWENIWL